ncbi:MAG: dihydropteroate synthase [Chloroflexi bacterium]|nr:dihydropteroate synthase [Chloroflexota bacterium]
MSHESDDRHLPPTPCGDTTFHWGTRTYVMGILNVTPDSFSGDGILDADAAAAHGMYLAAHGADVIDVGGESTRPGSEPVSALEEQRRVVPVIRALRQRASAPISVDTYRAEVAEAALDAGASIVNDVWGFQRDPGLAEIVARRGAVAIAMHNRPAPPKTAQRLGGFFPAVEYHDLLGEVVGKLRESIDILTSAGVPFEQIIVDPGIGFGKTPQHNLQLLAHLKELRALGRPVLLGTSRKSFIGLTLELPPDERVEGTAATVALGILHGADIVRVHDLPAMARVSAETDAVVRAGRDGG